VWASAPKIGRNYSINNFISAAILFAGGNATKCLRMLSSINIAVPAYRTFTTHQRKYLHGVCEYFTRWMTTLLKILAIV